jgi:uncharacterized protein (DUF58 family)
VSTWQPSTTLLRAALVSVAAAALAVVVGRPDLLVLVTPFVVHAAAGVLARPRAVPSVSSRLGTSAVREGEGTTLHVDLTDTDGVEHAVVALAPHRWTAARPANGVVATTLVPGTRSTRVDVPVAGLRWGRRSIGDGRVAATSAWAGHLFGPVPLTTHTLTTLPQPGRFDSRAAAPHPIGLVGTNPARRPGEGSEFSSIRPFQPGDRLRRVHWRVSLRTGSLHVTSTVAEEDASVLLVVDSGIEVGTSGGVHGSATTLDTAVRAAGAVAEHYLHRGDRVGLRVLGSTRHNAVPTAAGRRHLRRLLETLARVVPGENRALDPGHLRFRVPAGSVVLVFSPMLSQASLAATTTLAARGIDVVVVDTLPGDLDVGDDRRLALAWRMRMLERDLLLGRLAHNGIPVVAWRGPGTLDEVLRRLGRRASPAAGLRR